MLPFGHSGSLWHVVNRGCPARVSFGGRCGYHEDIAKDKEVSSIIAVLLSSEYMIFSSCDTKFLQTIHEIAAKSIVISKQSEPSLKMPLSSGNH